MAIKRLDRLPKRKVTVDEILSHSSVNNTLDELNEMRPELEWVLVIYEKRDGVIGTPWANYPLLRRVYALEVVKQKAIIDEALED